MQACVTLNHAFHGQHHLNVARPFYQLSLMEGGLLLPAAYPVMFVVALFPTFFANIMKCRLALWTENYEMLEHNSDCIGSSRIAQAICKGQTARDCQSKLKGISH
jgi:alkane 1-monooxygenase